ncbi:uncharacterized protein LTHEOB_10628 [Lasiodiplodia theobromae]|uniref:uncharacterized protein n=1 Tax=Lasiodiplodia theobromae TaxID=45133 RepID=UPI0015C3D412|nr:uncharacterized protein LTHEOB_10628 [Lasiodiplodia theobromae]KAF4538537.1 hypothetical protein LTHEOB_10628 [Lasiodiplodia theobromae]
MSSTTYRFLVAFALISLVVSTMGLGEMDLKNQGGRPKPFAERLLAFLPRNANPDSPTDRVQTVDTQDLTTSLQSVVGSPSATLPPVATGSTVHTGGVGGSPTSAASPTTTSGVLGPNTTGSVPSNGNVVPGTATGSTSADASRSRSGSGEASIKTTSSARGSGSAAASASASSSASLTGSSQPQGAAAVDNAVGISRVLGVVIAGMGWLL